MYDMYHITTLGEDLNIDVYRPFLADTLSRSQFNPNVMPLLTTIHSWMAKTHANTHSRIRTVCR